MQQFLDMHGRAVLASPFPLSLVSSWGHANAVPLFPGRRRLCWRPPTRYALFLHRATPMRSYFSRADAAFVGVPLPATPCFSIGPRQHDRKFPGRTPPLLAPPSPLRLISSPCHANAVPLFPGGRRLYWRPPPRCALFLRLATPTRSHFSRADAAFIGVPLPAAPYFFVGSRQRGPTFPGRTPPLLAPHSPLRLIPSPRHANIDRKFPDMLTYLGARKLKKRDSPNNYPAHIHKATSSSRFHCASTLGSSRISESRASAPSSSSRVPNPYSHPINGMW